MAKVKFEFSIEKLTFKFEGDQDTGQAVSESMQRTLGSVAEAQSRVIDVTPREEEQPALPTAPAPKRRKHRAKPKTQTNGDGAVPPATAERNGATDTAKPTQHRRPRGESFRDLVYVLIREGFLGQPRTAQELRAELSRRGHNFDPKRVASDLLEIMKKHYLDRAKNEEGVWAYVKGASDDFPGSQGGS